MNDCLERAQKLLAIQSVDLNSSEISFREGLDWSVEKDKRSEMISQGYRSFISVAESQFTRPESNTEIDNHEIKEFWEYAFRYRVGTRLIFRHEEEAANQNPDFSPIVKIEAQFIARYYSPEEIDNDCIEAFCADNIGYHVWPYWREYVQSSCQRLGIYPPLPVPVYIISNKKVTLETEEE